MKMTSHRKKNRLVLEVDFSTAVLWDVAGILYKIVTKNIVFEFVCYIMLYSQ